MPFQLGGGAASAVEPRCSVEAKLEILIKQFIFVMGSISDLRSRILRTRSLDPCIKKRKNNNKNIGFFSFVTS
jgi:hypothetical protein